MKTALDFICIGAPKAATSTLFELIEGHPDIYIPPAKEVPYFNDDELYQKGWSWYTKTFFSDAKKDQITGTMTPQYMSGFGVNTPEKIAERIHSQLPNVKIIALLRHPIERSFSQHKMHKRYGFIDESFDESVARLISNKNLDDQRKHIDQSSMFLFASEYGRIMARYYQLFQKKHILVLFTDDFEKDPEQTLHTIFEFLHVDKSYKPDNINRRSHTGSGKAKIKFLTPGFLKKHPIINSLWKRLVPINARKKIFMQVTRWNIKPDDNKLDPNGAAYKKLQKFFKHDIKQLEASTGLVVPWKDLR
jgi:hypothetical protein